MSQIGYGHGDTVGAPFDYYTGSTLVTGFNITMQTAAIVLNPSGTLAAGTVVLPLNPPDGCLAEITALQQITSLTVSANTGDSLAYGVPVAVTELIPTNTATAGAANATVKYRYTLGGFQPSPNVAAINPRTWLRVQ